MQGLEVVLRFLRGNECSKLNVKSGNFPVAAIPKHCETCNSLFCWQTVGGTKGVAQRMFLTENIFFQDFVSPCLAGYFKILSKGAQRSVCS